MASTTLNDGLVQPSRKRLIAFYIPVVLITLMLIVFTGILAPALPYIVTGWFISAAETAHHRS